MIDQFDFLRNASFPDGLTRRLKKERKKIMIKIIHFYCWQTFIAGTFIAGNIYCWLTFTAGNNFTEGNNITAGSKIADGSNINFTVTANLTERRSSQQ